MTKRTLVVINSGNYNDSLEKGVQSYWLNFLEGGYFDRCYIISAAAKNDAVVNLFDGKVVVLQFGWQKFLYKLIPIKSIFFLVFPLVFARIFWSIYKISPDLIRATNPYHSGLVGLIISKLLKIPFMVSIHADYLKCAELSPSVTGRFASSTIGKTIKRYVLKNSNLIAPIRKYLLNSINYDIVGSKSLVSIFPHPVNLSRIKGLDCDSHKDFFETYEDSYLLSFVGRLSAENYVLDLIKLAKNLIERDFKSFRLLICGDGPLKERLTKDIKLFSLEEHIRLLGFKEFNFIISLRKKSDFAICFMGGMSLLEAGACECPVLSYDIEWHSEVIQNQVTGILVPEYRVDLAADRLIQALTKSNQTKQLGINLKNYINDNFNSFKVYQHKKSVYDKILN